MKRIGFSKKYFTLWKIAEELEWEELEGVNLPYLKRDLQFIKNLSFDEKTAKRKSIFEGVENYEVDFGLCSPKYLEKKEIDLDEIFFEFCNHRKESDKKILLENGFEDIDGQVVFPEHAKKIQQSKINKMQNETMFSEKTILKLQELKISMYEAKRAIESFSETVKQTNQKKFLRHATTERNIGDLNTYVGEYLFEQGLICDGCNLNRNNCEGSNCGYQMDAFFESKNKNEVAKLAFDAIGHRYYNYSMKVKNSFKNGN